MGRFRHLSAYISYPVLTTQRNKQKNDQKELKTYCLACTYSLLTCNIICMATNCVKGGCESSEDLKGIWCDKWILPFKSMLVMQSKSREQNKKIHFRFGIEIISERWVKLIMSSLSHGPWISHGLDFNEPKADFNKQSVCRSWVSI